MLLSIILTTHNNVNKSLNIISDILRSKNLEKIELVIVDNNTKNFDFKDYLNFLKQTKLNFKFLFEKKANSSFLARITGLKNAIGEYVVFFDPDDRLEINDFDKAITLIEKNKDYDLIFFNAYFNSIKQNLPSNNFFIYASLWNKFFRRESFDLNLFKDIIFQNLGEDLLLLSTFQLRAKNVYTSKLCFYNYMTLQGISWSSDFSFYTEASTALKYFIRLNRNYANTELYKYTIWYLYYIAYAPNVSMRGKKPDIKLFNNIAKLDIKKLFKKEYLKILPFQNRISTKLLNLNLWWLFSIGPFFMRLHSRLTTKK